MPRREENLHTFHVVDVGGSENAARRGDAKVEIVDHVVDPVRLGRSERRCCVCRRRGCRRGRRSSHTDGDRENEQGNASTDAGAHDEHHRTVRGSKRGGTAVVPRGSAVARASGAEDESSSRASLTFHRHARAASSPPEEGQPRPAERQGGKTEHHPARFNEKDAAAAAGGRATS